MAGLIASAIGLGLGAAGGISVGSVLFQGRLPVKNYDQYSLEADEDEGIPLPPPPKDGMVSGKPRAFLQYAPSWAKHPDYDRVGDLAKDFDMTYLYDGLRSVSEQVLWLNTAMRTMWPYYNQAVGQQVLEQVNPIIAEQIKPYPFIQAVDIEVLDLGTEPPAIGGAKSYSAANDEAIIEAPVLWGGDARVRVTVRIKVGTFVLYLPVEVCDLQIRGLARITLAPLVDTLPCLGAVQITLLEEPYIDFSISLFGSLDLMLLPILKDAVNMAANKVLGDLLVYPNRMSFDIMPGGGKPPEPVGLLVVKVKAVTNIKAGGDLFSKVDPFVDMSVRDGRSQRTKTIWNNKDPTFNQVLSFIVDDPEHQSITAMVKDDDMQAFSKALGVSLLSLHGAEFMEQPRKVCQLSLPMYKPEAHGQLLKLAKVGAGATNTVKSTTGMIMPGAPKEEQEARKSGDHQDNKAAKDLDHEMSKDPKRMEKMVVATLECDVQYCPFKSSGEDAQKKHHSSQQAAAPGKKLMRRATKSIITLEHKGVLTVQVISASNLSTPDEKGDVDPYVELLLFDPATRETKKQQTSHLQNEPSPKWGEKFDFPMVSAPSILTVNVWDKMGWMEGRLSIKGLTGRKASKQKIGNVRLSVSDVVRNGKIRDSWALQDTQKGDITIKMTWTSVELDADSDIKAEEGDDDVDEEMAEEIENAPVNNSGGQ